MNYPNTRGCANVILSFVKTVICLCAHMSGATSKVPAHVAGVHPRPRRVHLGALSHGPRRSKAAVGDGADHGQRLVQPRHDLSRALRGHHQRAELCAGAGNIGINILYPLEGVFFSKTQGVQKSCTSACKAKFKLNFASSFGVLSLLFVLLPAALLFLTCRWIF